MGLDFNRPSSGPAPVLEVAPAQGQEEYQAYDVEADRRQMTQIMVNSPEVDSLARDRKSTRLNSSHIH